MGRAVSRRYRPSGKLTRVGLLAGLVLVLTAALIGFRAWRAGAAVTLVKFEATWQSTTSILVVWETSSELDTTAFFLYRAESPNGPWDFYIDWEPAVGDEFTGASYSYVDREVTQGITYYYRLEETTSDGSSNFFGPVMATGGTSGTTLPRTSTSTPTATAESDVPPTATRQYTNTPPPASTTQATTFTSPLPAPIPPRVGAARPTPLQPARVTTPTPLGGVVESPPTEGVLPSPTPTLPAEATESMATATFTATATSDIPTPTATISRLAAASNATSQPLLDTAAIELAAAPVTAAGKQQSPSRLTPLLGIVGGVALAAAVLLGAVAALVWRARSH